MHFDVRYEPARTTDHGSVAVAECWVIFRVFADGTAERVRSFGDEPTAARHAAFMNR